MTKKVYKCCICHNELDNKPHRLVHQEYKHVGYGHFINQHNFDFCDKCFKTFRGWIIKHKEATNDKS